MVGCTPDLRAEWRDTSSHSLLPMYVISPLSIVTSQSHSKHRALGPRWARFVPLLRNAYTRLASREESRITAYSLPSESLRCTRPVLQSMCTSVTTMLTQTFPETKSLKFMKISKTNAEMRSWNRVVLFLTIMVLARSESDSWTESLAQLV